MKLTKYFTSFQCKTLKQHGIETLEEAIALPDDQLLKISGIGKMFVTRLRYIAYSLTTEKERVENQIDAELKESAQWYGSWDLLRERIAMLEENEKEASYDRAYDPERQ